MGQVLLLWSGRVCSFLIKYRSTFTIFSCTVPFFIAYLIDNDPGRNRFTSLFPQSEYTVLIVAALAFFLGHLFDHFRKVNVFQGLDFYSNNPFFFLQSFFLLLVSCPLLMFCFGVVDEVMAITYIKYIAFFSVCAFAFCFVWLRRIFSVFSCRMFPFKNKYIVLYVLFFIVFFPLFLLGVNVFVDYPVAISMRKSCATSVYAVYLIFLFESYLAIIIYNFVRSLRRER
ncbi:hypothetical protein [Maridesulfovibrio sp.]|uniref:hypothetical protein n=1 Tax=Maridesulfovibrio sp. TaxID=2795000 RepID=UPI002A18853E|nr:hypothetical protein [Maridesulfovibrio sp.]